MTDQQNLPDFEETEQAPMAPKRQRRKPQKKPTAKKRRVPREVPKAAVPKRARKKRVPRRLPGRQVEIHANGTPPMVGPEAAGVIRAYMALDEASRAVVFAYISALR